VIEETHTLTAKRATFSRSSWLRRYVCEIRLHFIMAGLASGCFVMMPTASAQNLVSDPGFESVQSPIGPGVFCQAASWTTVVGGCDSNYQYQSYAHSGTYALQIGTTAAGPANISQSISGLQAGRYAFSFWYEVVFPSPSPVSAVTASVGGQTFSISANSATPFIQFNQQVTLGAGSATVTFTNGPPGNYYWQTAIDDVSLILLSATPSTLSFPGDPPTNVVNVANAINNFTSGGGTLPADFQNLFNLSSSQLATALTQLDGEAATDAEKGAFALMNQFLGLMLDPFVDGRFGGAPGATPFAPEAQADFPPDIALAYASVLKAPAATPAANAFAQRWTAWGSAFGASSTINGNAAIGSNNVTASDYGFAAGMDYHATPNTVYGFGLAGSGTNWNLAQGLGTGRGDAFQAGIYSKGYWGPAYLAAALAFTNNWFSTNRTALGDEITASYTGQSYGGRLETGYRYAMPVNGTVVGTTPYAAIQTQWFHTPTYSETDLTGGGLGLTYNAVTANDTRSELGLGFDDPTLLNGMPLILRARFAWAHDWVTNPSLDAVFQSLPGSSFIVNGATPPKNSALASAGGQYFLSPAWSFTAKFDGEFASGTQTYGGTGTLRYTW
jgi:uncharacterized protein with beta-barrel porin domain